MGWYLQHNPADLEHSPLRNPEGGPPARAASGRQQQLRKVCLFASKRRPNPHILQQAETKGRSNAINQIAGGEEFPGPDFVFRECGPTYASNLTDSPRLTPSFSDSGSGFGRVSYLSNLLYVLNFCRVFLIVLELYISP